MLASQGEIEIGLSVVTIAELSLPPILYVSAPDHVGRPRLWYTTSHFQCDQRRYTQMYTSGRFLSPGVGREAAHSSMEFQRQNLE